MCQPSKAERVAFWQDAYALTALRHSRDFIDRWLNQSTEGDKILRRALETAILITYAGPFKQRTGVKLASLSRRPSFNQSTMRSLIFAIRLLRTETSAV